MRTWLFTALAGSPNERGRGCRGDAPDGPAAVPGREFEFKLWNALAGAVKDAGR